MCKKSCQKRCQNNSDNCAQLPMSVCPLPPVEDCPISAVTGCLGLFVVGALCLWALLAVWPAQPPACAPVVENENPYLHYTLFSLHWEKCPQCRAPIINANGEETGGLCEMGFRLLQEDMRTHNSLTVEKSDGIQ